MTETRLKHDKTAAIGQLCNLKHGDAVIYNIGHDRGPLGHVMQWLSGRGGLALVQRPIGKPGSKPRPESHCTAHGKAHDKRRHQARIQPA